MGRRNLLLAVQDHPYIYVVVGEISRSIIICWEFEIWNIQYSEKLMVSGKMYIQCTVSYSSAIIPVS